MNERGRIVCIAVIVVQYSILVYGACSDTLLNDLTLRDPSVRTGFWNNSIDPVISDTSLNYEWYRTVHNGWQYLMTDSANTPNYTACSTYYPIFLKETHPLVDALTETPVEVIACKRDYLYPCDIQHEIKIRKCDEEVEYYLPPSKRYSAYCFEKASQQHLCIPAPHPKDVALGDVTVLPELDFKVTNVPGPPESYNNYNPYFQIRCNFNIQEELFYKVNWYVDGAFIVHYGPSKNSETLLFHEDVLTNNSISMGFEIHCGVSVLASECGEETEMMYSDKYFAGIKVLNQHVTIEKGESAVVQIKSTLPIGCRYDEGDEVPVDDCIGGFQIFDPDDFDCTLAGVVNEGEIHNQRCTRGIQTLKNGSTWDPDTIFNFTIVTTDMNYNDKLNFQLLLQFSSTLGHSLWREYNFPIVSITVRDSDNYKQKICYSHTDPQIRTADKLYYTQVNDKNGQKYPGVFMLYRNFKYGIEVQVTTRSCGWRGTCNCGIAIRAGKDVFMINRCGSIRYLGFTRCDDGGILQVVKQHDKKYNVFTPIGTTIEIDLLDTETSINVDITLAPKDFRNIEGLCGSFDNDSSNDQRPRGGSTSTGFAESWSLLEEDMKELNLFLSDGKRELKSWGEQNGMFCVCNSTEAEAFCYPTQYLQCKMDKSITGTKCFVPNRKKRSVLLNNKKEMKRLLALMEASNPNLKEHTLIRKRRQDNEYMITEEQAKVMCTDKINGSLAVNSYGEVNGNEDPDAVINQCVFDVTEGNDTLWVSAHLESVNNIVKSMIDKEPLYAQNNTEKVKQFMLNTCPGNCSNNGICLETGFCDCSGFYHGPDCLIDERDPLDIDDIEGGGECDLADGIECKCFHVRSTNILEGFRCYTNVSKVTVEGTTTSVSSTSFSGGYEDIFTGVCCVQDDIIGTDNVFVAKYSISISNDGETYGNDKNVYVFDSTCQDAVVSIDGNASFSLKPGNCFIDGYCRADNEMALAGCRACQSSIESYGWTEYNPCENGGNCTDETDGYTCSCASGYGGKKCEYDIDECGSHPCQNGGTCTDFLNGYSCSCMDGFTGTDCAININECVSHPCQNNGLCNDGVNEFVCECAPGFNGIQCETEIDECLPGPCENGGSCSDLINGYVCTCAAGFYGVNCSVDINECIGNPCENSGTCEDQVNDRICNCVAGFEGTNCEIDINECENSPCLNGGSCLDIVNEYRCTCKEGFNGSDCEQDINECLPEPCQNGGTCEDRVNGYICDCPDGYDGTTCSNDINECRPGPCKNGGTCTDLVNGYECTCITGYDGDNCENDVNECSPEPCLNGGTCEDRVNGYICICSDGFDGSTCNNDINECLPDPCQNGATCKDLVNGYECTCIAGYDGDNCENEINECLPNPCFHDGACEDQIDGYLCKCSDGYDGTTCSNDINECLSDPCQNGATCKDLVNRYECTCIAGYDGDNCENDVNECSPEPCLNGGTCEDQVNGYICKCPDGYDGTTCNNDINECFPDPCHNGATCKDLVNGYKCTCVAGYDGDNCENDVNECSPEPCLNGGTCEDLVNGYICKCPDGYDGTTCNNDINECLHDPCQNGATCKDLVNGYECTCIAGYDGDNCENDINDCLPDPCQNGATCKDLVNGYECTCIAGYDGDNCEIDINECLPNPCFNKGTCEDQVNGYLCKCTDGYDGSSCNNDINECLPEPCLNGGTCEDRENGYICKCPAGFDDISCSNDIDDCVPNPCKNGGTCDDLINGYECTCTAGYEGVNCEEDINECIPDPCQNGGTCGDRVNGYICNCLAGFDGSNCSNDINNCFPDPCHNEGTCNDLINGYECKCEAGYEGENCGIDANDCVPDPCQNGGTCEDRVNGHTCQCLAGYDGLNCSNEIDECFHEPCKNGGFCKDLINGYECTCVDGYHGVSCGEDINECLPDPCKNRGTCEDRVNGYICKCLAGFNGTTCSNDIDECVPNPCKNGGTCKDVVNKYECTCIAGYDGDNCENDVNECLPDPCLNGGTCEDRVNGYICKCIAGYDGTTCSIDIDECLPEPCKNGATCHDLVNGYECTCIAGYDGDYCEHDINECSPEPCLNGGTCEDQVNGYICRCPNGYDGTTCSNDIDECFPNPCKNGATCRDLVNGYECTCIVGYDGDSCEYDIDECLPNSCKNGATCKDLVNGYECTCIAGFDGDNCDNDIDECLSGPCENDGICEDLVNGYTCKCTDGYKGINCQDENNLSTTEIPAVGIAQTQVVMVLPIKAKNIDLNDTAVHEDIVSTLTIHYRRSMGERLKEIVLLNLRYGSIIVDFQLRYENSTSAVDDLTKANVNLLNGEDKLVLLNELVSAMSVQINDVTVTNDTIQNEGTLCKMFEAINGFCQDSRQCSLVDGNPTCVKSEAEKDEMTLVIVVVVCSIVVPVIVALIVCLSIRAYRMKQKPTKYTTKHAHSSGFEEIGQWRQHPSYKLYGGQMSGRRPSSDSYYPDRDWQSSASGYKC